MKTNMDLLVGAGKATQFGENWPGQRCLATTRSGGSCQKPALRGKDRCQLHGGKTPTTSRPKPPQHNFHHEIREIARWAQKSGYTLKI